MESSSKHYKITTQGKKYDARDTIAADLPAAKLPEGTEEVTLSGNSYGREACDHIAETVLAGSTGLKTVNFNDMFVSRKLLELPGSLEVLIRAIMTNEVEHLNLSDNAFGPAGIKTFDFLLEQMSSLKTLKVTNCGLGPEGGEMIA